MVYLKLDLCDLHILCFHSAFLTYVLSHTAEQVLCVISSWLSFIQNRKISVKVELVQ